MARSRGRIDRMAWFGGGTVAQVGSLKLLLGLLAALSNRIRPGVQFIYAKLDLGRRRKWLCVRDGRVVARHPSRAI